MRGGRWLCGLTITASLAAFFTVTGVFGSDPGFLTTLSGNGSAALFFSVILGYIVPVFDYISTRTVEAIDELAEVIPGGPERVQHARTRVHHKPRVWHAVVLAIGVSAAIAHNAVLALEEDFGNGIAPAWLALVIGTALTWLILTVVIAALMDNARLLNQVARDVRINPFAPQRLRPFATVAVLSTLAIIGAQAAFPIMIFDAEVSAVAFVPGLIATIVPMLVLAVLPIWPLHARLRAAKLDLLAEANRRIDAQPLPQSSEVAAVGALLPLLAYRREIQALSEWPFDGRTVGRLVFYLIIPPLTWVGAALIEHFVEGML
jgi:hypothetical protein